MTAAELTDATNRNILPDSFLLEQAAAGRCDAFGELVTRYQSLVSGLAYSIVGDLGQSEDVAQDTFVAAWKQLGKLENRSKFPAWVCGIARNLAHTSLRRRRPRPADGAFDALPSSQPSPAEQSITREEIELVGRALERLEPTYREPLVLFYREQMSVARVAAALELSEDAVKQRLSRGRQLLRGEMATVVERALVVTRPGPVFTGAVLAALPSVTAGSLLAAAGGAANGAAPLAKAAASMSAMGWLAGLAGGVLGPALGLWATWQTAQYQRQRALLRRFAINFSVIFAVFLLPFVALDLELWSPRGSDPRLMLIAQVSWIGLFQFGLGIVAWRFGRKYSQVLAEEAAAGSPVLPVSSGRRRLENIRGRRWTSRRKLLGLPLVDVQFADPFVSMTQGLAMIADKRIGHARGWIALGDRAEGILFAVGSIATGGVAVGGLTCGLVSVGGAAAGGLALGGLAVGVVPVGGLALGVAALGGLAIGYWAFGGGALAWRAAQGGFAWAHDYAVGGQVFATHAGDAAAQQYVQGHSFFATAAQWPPRLGQLGSWFAVMVLAATLLLLAGLYAVSYRRKS